MKFSIFTEAGRNIGFGHLTRCIALYQAVEEKNNNSELIVKGNDSVINFIKDKKYKIFNWIQNSEKTKKLVKNSDFVIIDSYLADKALYDKISRLTCGKLLMIDDYKRIDYPEGIVINPSIYGDKLDYPKNNQVKYLLGKDYIILRKEFWDIPGKRINKEVKEILISLGDAGKSKFIERFLKFLSISFPNFQYHIVSNCRIKNIFGLNLKIYNNLSASEMLILMLKADICISGGGQTTYELARVGAPTIGICFVDNQLNNLKYGNLSGYLKFTSTSNDDSLFKKIKDAFAEIISFEHKNKMSKLGRYNIDGKGAKRIVEFLKDEILL